MRKLRFIAALACAIFVGISSASAATVTYNFTWTGSAASGQSMIGSFTGTDTNTDGYLRDSEVSALSFEGFVNGISQGTENLAHTFAGFNFNFDLASHTFMNGHSKIGDGQEWNWLGTGIGFGDGNLAGGLSLDGSVLGQLTKDPQSFTVQLSVVPLPAALPLYGAGLAVMGFLGWRRSRKV